MKRGVYTLFCLYAQTTSLCAVPCKADPSYTIQRIVASDCFLCTSKQQCDGIQSTRVSQAATIIS